MKIYTSYFAKSSRHPRAVSIARFSPRWYGKGRRYIQLAPSPQLLKSKLPPDQWREEYQTQVLDRLDPLLVALELGDGAVMLCFEKPGEICHRHYVADWLRERCKIEVEEIGVSRETEKPECVQESLL